MRVATHKAKLVVADSTRGMQSIVGRAELAISVQPHQRAAELSGLLHIVLLYEVGIR